MFLRGNKYKSKYQLPCTAIYMDFDEVINLSAEADNKGFIGGKIIAQDDLTSLNLLCRKHRIPIYVITNRADSDVNTKHVTDLINSVKGFSEEGGFKKVYYLGVESKNRRGKTSLIGTKMTKLAQIKVIHQAHLKHLSNASQCFIDDDIKNISPVKEAGYTTFHVGATTDKHFTVILDFVQEKINPSYSSGDESKKSEPFIDHARLSPG